MEKKECPYCGFIGHAVSSNDGRYWKYVCERCKRFFTVDGQTGEVI